MNYLIWNVRGLNDPIKQVVVNRISSLNLSIVGLLETRVKEASYQKIVEKQFRG